MKKLRIIIPVIVILLMVTMVAFSTNVPLGPYFDDSYFGLSDSALILSADINDLDDVTVTSPGINHSLVYDGDGWINKDMSNIVGAGGGLTVYFDDDVTVDDYASLIYEPDTVTAETTKSVVANNNTVFIEGYLYNVVLQRDYWAAGEWQFNIFAKVNSSVAESYIIPILYRVQDTGGTVTTTGTGTSRTATIDGATPLVAGDANATETDASFLQTAGGAFHITGYTSTTVCTIATDSEYVNETAVTYTLHRKVFEATTEEINNINADTVLYHIKSIQPRIDLDLADKAAVRMYGKTTRNSDVTISFTYNGTDRYSFLIAPVFPKHNDLDGLNLGDYKHLTANEYTLTTDNVKFSKFDGTAAPAAATDDITLGYVVGSRWVDVTNDKEYVCLDNTDGAAVWTETTGAGGGASTFTGLTDTPAAYTDKAGKTLKVNSTPDAVEFANDTNITTKTTTATLTVAEQGTILVSASSAYTITLPTAVGNTGLTYHFKKTDANYNLITLDGNGAETFNYENADGTPKETYARLNTYCAEVTVVSDGVNWQVIDEALGQVPRCWAYLSADQLNLTDNLAVKVLLDTEDYDIGSNFDTANNKFVCPVAGYYFISGKCLYKNGTVVADKIWYTRLHKNEVLMDFIILHSSSTEAIIVVCEGIYHLAKDDYIELYARHTAGVNTPDLEGVGAHATHMAIEMIAKD